MGWGNCGEDGDGRPIGYNVEATCDHPGCNAGIDRGLSYVCGSMHLGGEHGCGRYFCGKHLTLANGSGEQLCPECLERWDKFHGSDEE